MDQPRLCDRTCVPCRGGIPPLTSEAIAPLMAQVPAWTLADDGLSIARAWKFKTYKEAEAFVLKIGEIAEAEGHHPDVEFGWGYARVKLWTHAIKGLHENDFIVAAKIETLL